MDIGTLGLLSIGALIGWFIHQLLDIAFWRNRRICTDSEVGLQKRIEQYEAEKRGYETRILDYEDRLGMYEKGGAPAGGTTITYGDTADYDVEYDVDTPETAGYAPDIDTNRADLDTDLNLPKVDFTPPSLDVDVPQMDVPDVELPHIDIPDVELPDVTMPQLDVPDISAKAGLVGAAGLATQIDMPSTPDAPDLEIDLPELKGDVNTDVDGGMGVEGVADDLKIVWGIGPAVEALLNDNGITTFVQLANTSIGELSDILNAGGDKFNMIQPYTWPDQARLANDGNWATLEKLQSELGE